MASKRLRGSKASKHDPLVVEFRLDLRPFAEAIQQAAANWERFAARMRVYLWIADLARQRMTPALPAHDDDGK